MQKSKTMFCGKCGTQLSDTDKFCPRCGEKVIPVIVEKEKPSINQEEVQKSENPTSLEQSKPLKDSNETRPKTVPLQNESDKQDNANANTQNIEVPGLGSFDRQQFAAIVACFAAAIIIPLIFVKGLGSLLIVGAVVGFGVTFILDQYKINPNNKVFYSIIAVAALAGTVKYANTPTTSKSSGGISSIFSIFKTKEQRIQDVRDLLAKAETVEDFEEVWNAYKSLATEEKLELGVAKFNMDYMIKMKDKLTSEEIVILDMKTGVIDDMGDDMGLY